MSADIGGLSAPAHLDTRDLPTQQIAGSFVRIHQCRYSALYFGKTGVYRFDAPHHEYGVLYIADHVDGAFVETFRDVWDVQGSYNIVSAARLASRCVSAVHLARPMTVCDLTGEGLARIGADGRLTSGDRLMAQQWISTTSYRHMRITWQNVAGLVWTVPVFYASSLGSRRTRILSLALRMHRC